MSQAERHPLIAGTVVTSLGTLASRLLGLLPRAGDKFFVRGGRQRGCRRILLAFRIPNLFRQVF